MDKYSKYGLQLVGLGLIGVLWGCNPAPVVAGGRQTCATKDGRVRCWGYGGYGALGYANTNSIGDNENPSTAGDVNVGGSVKQVVSGYYHACALLTSGAVRCWGRADSGQLGYGNTNRIGDNETPASAGNVSLGGTATEITAGVYHTCALLTTGDVRCWGGNAFGQLGIASTRTIGDDETPTSVAPAIIGGAVSHIAAGSFHTCALLTSGAVRCWGYGGSGQLGYGNTNSIGDSETPASAGNVSVGGVVTQLTAGASHTCALLDDGGVKCWGAASSGQLGYANVQSIGDNELPSTVGKVNVGKTVIVVTAGGDHTCALTSDNQVRCWGENLYGVLGYPGPASVIGDNETPASVGDVNTGGNVVSLSAGYYHNCAVISDGVLRVRCWGNGSDGKLGYHNTNNVGDNETPAMAGDVVVE